MKKRASIAALLALVVAVLLLATSDVQAGAALTPATKTTGASMTANIVIDVTPGSAGATSIRVQKASVSTAAIFNSGYVAGMGWKDGCLNPFYTDLKASTAYRFTGFIDTLVGNGTIQYSLFHLFGIPVNAAIVDQDYVACTAVGNRWVLSFTAVIQFDVFGP